MTRHKLPNYGKGEKEGIHEDFKGFHARRGTKGPSFLNKPAKAFALKKRTTTEHINAERKRQGYKPISAKDKRIHEGMDKFY